MVRALQHDKAKRIAVVTPYHDAVNAQLAAFLADVRAALARHHEGLREAESEFARVERDYRDQPLVFLKESPEPLTVSRTFAHLFKAM